MKHFVLLMLLSLSLAGELTSATSDTEIHDFLLDHTQGQGVVYYMQKGEELDDDTLNRIVQFADVI